MARTEINSGIALRDWALFLIALLVIALDQASKYLIRTNLSLGQSIPEGSPIRLTYYTNTGAAFSLLPNKTFLFIIVAFIAIAIIVFYSRQLPSGSVMVRMGLGLQLGGAIGNLIDRLIHGHVTDFIDVSVWPVFNIADSAIVIGVGLLAYFLLIQTPQQPKPVTVEGSEPQRES